MARSIEEIDADIAAVQQQISMRNALGYKTARAKAILDHDTSGLERIYSLMNQAEQNRMQRQLTESENDKFRKNALAIAFLNKVEAAEERKRKDKEIAALKLEQARPEYLKIQKAMLDAIDAGNMEDADILQRQLAAIEAEHGAKFGTDSKSLLTAREEGRKAKQEKEIKAAEARLAVANFLSGLPTTFKNEDEKKSVYEAINNRSDMTPDEKAKEIERVRNIKSGATKTNEAVQGAVASSAGDDVKKAKEEREKGIALARKAKQKKASGRILLKSEQDALDKWGKEL